MDHIRVLLVDDHNVVRQGLKLFLATQPDIEVVAEADNGAVAVTAVASTESSQLTVHGARNGNADWPATSRR